MPGYTAYARHIAPGRAIPRTPTSAPLPPTTGHSTGHAQAGHRAGQPGNPASCYGHAQGTTGPMQALRTAIAQLYYVRMHPKHGVLSPCLTITHRGRCAEPVQSVRGGPWGTDRPGRATMPYALAARRTGQYTGTGLRAVGACGARRVPGGVAGQCASAVRQGALQRVWCGAWRGVWGAQVGVGVSKT